MVVGGAAAGISATLWDDAWVGAGRELEEAGRAGNGSDALVGHELCSGAGTKLEAEVDDKAVVMAGTAASF